MGRHHHTKTDVVVEVSDVVIVAAGTARVPLIVDEGTAAQHTALDRSALPLESDTGIIAPFFKKIPAFGGRERTQDSEIQKTEIQNLQERIGDATTTRKPTRPPK